MLPDMTIENKGERALNFLERVRGWMQRTSGFTEIISQCHSRQSDANTTQIEELGEN
ncbi:MAG: hypothetical protein FWC11_04725 [Firmicutes bacterium]|nr:hypothetical protein [Bacillota bacterium]MCL2256146.1 hypothetical protein [Bacillota bacterium]